MQAATAVAALIDAGGDGFRQTPVFGCALWIDAPRNRNDRDYGRYEQFSSS